MNIQSELRRRFAEILASYTTDTAPLLEMIRPTQDAKFGDYQVNFAMPLAGRLGKKSRDIAAEIVSRLKCDDLCETPEIAGPGFINLKLRTDWLEATTNAIAADPREGVETVAQTKTYVVDFSGPNVAKP